MLLTVVIYVLLGYEDNNMWFGYVSSVIMERAAEAIFLLWAAKRGLQSFFVIRSTASMPSKIGMLLVSNRSCFLGIVLEKCSNVENWQSSNALCGCRCCRWSKLGSDLYLCICMQAYAHVKVCLNHPFKDCGEYFGSMPAASLVTTSTSCRQGMLMEVIFGYRVVEITYYSSYQIKTKFEKMRFKNSSMLLGVVQSLPCQTQWTTLSIVVCWQKAFWFQIKMHTKE